MAKRKYTMSKVKLYDWDDNSAHTITTSWENDRYLIQVDGAFWSTAELFSEVYSEIKYIMKLYDWKVLPLLSSPPVEDF